MKTYRYLSNWLEICYTLLMILKVTRRQETFSFLGGFRTLDINSLDISAKLHITDKCLVFSPHDMYNTILYRTVPIKTEG